MEFSIVNPLFEIQKKVPSPDSQKGSASPGRGRFDRISAMKTTLKIPILHRLGIHLRAGAQLVQVASRFKSRIMVSKGGAAVNAKSLIDLLTIGAIYGSVLEFSAEGSDASEAVQAIRELLNEWKEKDGKV